MIGDVATVVLALALALCVTVIVWLVQRTIDLSNQLLTARASDATNALKAERSDFDLKHTQQALDGEKKQEQAVVDALATSSPNLAAGLAADDVDGRVRAIEAAGRPGPAAAAPGAGAAGPVRPASGTAPTAADLLRPEE